MPGDDVLDKINRTKDILCVGFEDVGYLSSVFKSLEDDPSDLCLYFSIVQERLAELAQVLSIVGDNVVSLRKYFLGLERIK